MQEFRDLFSSEVLAPGRQLAVSHVAFLFSDLKGSTRLYEGLGDAPAYSRVSRHFDFIRKNLAARVADQSRGGDVVVLRQVLGQASGPVAEGSGVTVEHFTTRLRGLDADQHLVRLTRAVGS